MPSGGLEVANNVEYRGGEDGCEDAVEGETEAGKGTVTVADAEGARGAYGVGGGAYRQALCHWAMHVRPAHHGEAHDAAEDAHAHHHGCGEGGDAAERTGHLHGDRGGDTFCGERHDNLVRRTAQVGYHNHGDDARDAAAERRQGDG